MLADERTIAVRKRCEATLRTNWREGSRAGDGVRFAYTCPSPGHYPVLAWAWQIAVGDPREEPGIAKQHE
jgi:hypothetical protein